MSKISTTAAAAVCLLAWAGLAQADDQMEQILDAAMPHMHHSCESVIDTYPDDADQVAEIVRLMAMVALYNRQIDVPAAIPNKADRAGLKDEFVEELEDACDDDPGRLLAGAVDLAVRDTIDAFD